MNENHLHQIFENYIKKFEDKDINDLKRFIDATVAFITYELISDEAEQLVNS